MEGFEKEKFQQNNNQLSTVQYRQLKKLKNENDKFTNDTNEI